MRFEKIQENTECNCIEGADEDLRNVYARKINKPSIRDTDMKSHWEKGRNDASNCSEECGFKGISMNSWTSESKQKTIETYLTTFKISPKSKDCIYVFRFKQGAGLVKHTPSKRNGYHHDFFKSDDFALDMLEGIEIVELRNLVEV